MIKIIDNNKIIQNTSKAIFQYSKYNKNGGMYIHTCQPVTTKRLQKLVNDNVKRDTFVLPYNNDYRYINYIEFKRENNKLNAYVYLMED